MTEERSRARIAVVWLGILALLAIGGVATAHLALDILRVGRAVVHGEALLAFAATVAALAAAVVALVLVARSAGGGPRGERLAIIAGFALLVGIRLVIAAAYDSAPSGETHEYDVLARHVLSGGSCCFGDRPMGYPLVLSAFYAVLGPAPSAVELLNLVLAVLAGASVLVLARRLYGPRVGAVALLAYALWPAGALMVAARLPHIAYDLVVVAAALPAVLARPGWRGSALVGALLALGQYLRPTTPALVPAYLLARVWSGPLRPWRRPLLGAVVPLVGVLLVLLLPVVYHDLKTHGELSISTSSFGGHSLYIGTDERSGGRYSRQAIQEIDALPGDQWERSRAASALAMERIREDPVGIALLAVRKQDTLWGTERYGVQYAIRRELATRPDRPAAMLPLVTSGVFYASVTLLAALGLYLKRERPDALAALLVAMIVCVAFGHALLEVRDRYHSYVVPLMFPFAAVAAAAILERLRLLGRETVATTGLETVPPVTPGTSAPASSSPAPSPPVTPPLGHTSRQTTPPSDHDAHPGGTAA